MALRPYTPGTFAGGMTQGLDLGYRNRARESRRQISEAEEATRQEEIARATAERQADEAFRREAAGQASQGIPTGGPSAVPQQSRVPAADGPPVGLPSQGAAPAVSPASRLDSLEAQAMMLNNKDHRADALARVNDMRTKGVVGQAAKARGMYQAGDMAGAVSALNEGWNLINPDAGSQFSVTEDGRVVTPDGQALDKQGMDLWFIEMGKAAQDPTAAMEWVREQRAQAAETTYQKDQDAKANVRAEATLKLNQARGRREEELQPSRVAAADMDIYNTADIIRSRREQEDIARVKAATAAKAAGAKTGWKTTEIESMQKDMNDWVMNTPETFFTLPGLEEIVDQPATANQILSDAKSYRVANPSDKMTREQAAMLAQLRYITNQGQPLPEGSPNYQTGKTKDGQRVVRLGNKVFLEP